MSEARARALVRLQMYTKDISARVLMAARRRQLRWLTVTFTSELLPGFVFLAESGHRNLEARVAPADEEAGAIGGRPGPADDAGLESSLKSVVSHFRSCEGGINVTAQQ